MNEEYEEISIGVKDFNIPKDSLPIVAICLSGVSDGEVKLVFSKKFLAISKVKPNEAKEIQDMLPDTHRHK